MRAHYTLSVLVLVVGCSSRIVSLTDGAPPPRSDGGCEIGVTVQPIQQFACSDVMYSVGAVVAASGHRLVYGARATFGSNSAADLDLFEMQTDTGAIQQLTGDDEDSVLLGADGDAVLFARREGYKEPYRLFLVRGQQPALELGSFAELSFVAGDDLYAYSPMHAVAAGRAVWRAVDTVYLFDGAKVVKLATLDKPYGSAPSLDEQGQVATWSAGEGSQDHEIYRRVIGGTTVQVTINATDDRHPVASQGRLFWQCDAGICMWSPDGGEVQLDQGTSCSAPDAHRGSAAWICDGSVRFYDGKSVRQVVAASPAVERFGLRLHAGRMVWGESDAKSSPYSMKGTLVLWDGRQARDLAEVGLPCVVCGMYWPPLSLVLTDQLVAWSYAEQLPSAKPPYEHCAYAGLRQECVE